MFLFCKTTYLDEGVKRTEPSLSVGVPSLPFLNKLECLIPVIHFHPCLIFRKAGAFQSGDHGGTPSDVGLLALPTNFRLG
jgi:hypothetical protein